MDGSACYFFAPACMAASLCCHCLFKIEYCSAVGVCVFPQEFLYHSGSFRQPFASVVSVDNGKDTPGFESHFGTFVVAGGSAYAACPVAVDGKPLDVQRSAPDAFEGFFRTSDAEFKAVSLYLVRIEEGNWNLRRNKVWLVIL